MRKIALVLIILSIISCKNNKNDIPAGFTINGYAENLNSTKVYLYNSTNQVVDSAAISNSKFKLSGISSTIEFATVVLKKDSLSIDVLLENVDFQLYASKNKQLIFGGIAQQGYNNYLEGLNKLKNSKQALSNLSIKKTNLSKELTALNSDIFTYQVSYLKNSSSSPIKNKILNNILNSPNLSVDKLFEIKAITDEFSDATIISKVNLALENIKTLALEKEQEAIKKAKLNVPKLQLAPLFSGEGLNGDNLSLASVLSGKKLVLIDFWASWCGPCRAVTPEIRYLYNKYKNKGFDIITISEDRNRDAWKAGLSEDQILMWKHIYDDNMRIAYMFNVSSIPHMVLLDGNGGIIDRKVSVNSLKQKLASTCK